MASNAFAGTGTLLQRSTTFGTIAFVTIAEVNEITGPNMTRDVIDCTSLSSTGGYREFIAGFRNSGEVQFDLNFALGGVGYDELKQDFESSVLRTYQIVLPDGSNTTLQFQGLVTALGVKIPAADKVTASCTIKISGSVTLST
jgi:predicted secreted protein